MAWRLHGEGGNRHIVRLIGPFRGEILLAFGPVVAASHISSDRIAAVRCPIKTPLQGRRHRVIYGK